MDVFFLLMGLWYLVGDGGDETGVGSLSHKNTEDASASPL